MSHGSVAGVTSVLGGSRGASWVWSGMGSVSGAGLFVLLGAGVAISGFCTSSGLLVWLAGVGLLVGFCV